MEVEIIVDEKALPLNGFTQDIIGNVAIAMAESLRGVEPEWKNIQIKVHRP